MTTIEGIPPFDALVRGKSQSSNTKFCRRKIVFVAAHRKDFVILACTCFCNPAGYDRQTHGRTESVTTFREITGVVEYSTWYHRLAVEQLYLLVQTHFR